MRRLAAVLLLAAAACNGGGGDSPDRPADLPPIAIAPCPAAEVLLPQPSGDLPDLTVKCLGDGPAVALRRLGGVPTVLNLWASWCGPCKEEMPALQRVNHLAGGRVRFVGVATSDSPKGARLAIQSTGVAYASLEDPKGELRRELGTVGMPTTLLIGADGKRKATLLGAKSEDEIKQAIRQHLGVTL